MVNRESSRLVIGYLLPVSGIALTCRAEAFGRRRVGRLISSEEKRQMTKGYGTA
jgi:hypothetical protein